MIEAPEGEEPEVHELLNKGLALYHANKPFEAHEVWEYAWGGEVGRSKLVLQVLITIAAGLYKHELGNPAGTCKLLAKAKEKLDTVRASGTSWLGLDLVQLDAELSRALAEADAIARDGAGTITPPPLPRVVSRDGIVYLHGFASGPTSAKARLLLPPLVEAGFAVTAPDFNLGDFEHLTISRSLELLTRKLHQRTILVGSSLGGYVAALAAARDERVKALVLMAPAFDFAQRMRARYGAAIDVWRRRGKTEVEHYALGGMRAIGFGLLEDAERHPPRPPIRVPTYILHGRGDDVVPASTSEAVAALYPGLVELELSEDDHALATTAPRAADAIGRMIERLHLERAPAPCDPEVVLRELEHADPSR